jgi:hypothetical protein
LKNSLAVSCLDAGREPVKKPCQWMMGVENRPLKFHDLDFQPGKFCEIFHAIPPEG